MDIMNISQQLDFRNVERHKGRNFYFDGSSGSQNQSMNIMNNSGQRSYTELPGLLGAKDKVMLSSPVKEISKNPIADAKRVFDKSMAKSSYTGAGGGSIDFNSIQLNPITGAVSPVQNNKKGSFL